MAVMDFREGGYVFARHKVKRKFSYDQNDWDDAAEHGSGDQRFAADPDGRERISARLARLTHYLGAIASVGLIVGLLVWGWELVSRDVRSLPVIQAAQGEARITPEDPGGELTSYTGYEVNKVAEGTESAPISQVAIAPNGNVLADEDVAMGEFGVTAREPQNPTDFLVNPAGEAITPLSDTELKAQAKAMAEAEAQAAAEHAAAAAEVANADIVDAPATEGAVNEVITDENGKPAQAAAIASALAEAQAIPAAGKLATSVRPAPRPRTARVAAATPSPAPAPAPAKAEASAATSEPAAPAARPAKATAPAEETKVAQTSSRGGPQVQIGAFDSDAIAQSEWQRLSGKFGSLFSGKGPVIQQHESNGRTYWRLRVAGFDSGSDAQNFCAAMKSGGTDCLALATQ